MKCRNSPLDKRISNTLLSAGQLSVYQTYSHTQDGQAFTFSPIMSQIQLQMNLTKCVIVKDFSCTSVQHKLTKLFFHIHYRKLSSKYMYSKYHRIHHNIIHYIQAWLIFTGQNIQYPKIKNTFPARIPYRQRTFDEKINHNRRKILILSKRLY